jgi:CPA1 family monovalent cation:H+ antiporter
MIGQKLKISYPILLLIGGVLISIVPGIPAVSLDPNLIFIIFLPPLLYEAAWYTSWNDFWMARRPISLLAFGLVFFTSVSIAFLSSSLIPGFTLGLGFLLGGIISPPDAVAATSILKGLPLPKRVLTILEGESLINDASSLIVFRFALAAIITGKFELHSAAGHFVLVTVMGIVVGLLTALVFYIIHKFLPTTPDIDTALSLLAPYTMYLAAEHFHFSGVMAVVTGGLFLSYRSNEIFNHQSRLQTNNVWRTLVFILNGLVFILIGLQLPVVVAGLNGYSIIQGIFYGIVISIASILIRLLWVYPATFIPRMLFKSIRESEPDPGLKAPFIVGWAGMRGVVSLAAALNIPLLLNDGTPFPYRNLILFITFIVILITLVLQGLTLPWLIRKLDIPMSKEEIPLEDQDSAIRIRLINTALILLNAQYRKEADTNRLVGNLRTVLETNIVHIIERLNSLEYEATQKAERDEYKKIYKHVLEEQRSELVILRKEKIYHDDELRKHQEQLDIEETRLKKRFL